MEANTITTKGRVLVCDGDSGGGAYVVQGNNRVLVGINSRVCPPAGESYLSSLATPQAREFFKTWIEDRDNAYEQIKGEHMQPEICGINIFDARCRN